LSDLNKYNNVLAQIAEIKDALNIIDSEIAGLHYWIEKTFPSHPIEPAIRLSTKEALGEEPSFNKIRGDD